MFELEQDQMIGKVPGSDASGRHGARSRARSNVELVRESQRERLTQHRGRPLGVFGSQRDLALEREAKAKARADAQAKAMNDLVQAQAMIEAAQGKKIRPRTT